jgi:DNA-binding NarL/FixJ family response regulator
MQPSSHPHDAAGPSVAPPIATLTPREREVAALVAEGLSNTEIARRLVISPGTAANHVAHIMRTLRAWNRVQVAVWAVEQGLYRSGRAPQAPLRLGPYRLGRAEDIATDAN